MICSMVQMPMFSLMILFHGSPISNLKLRLVFNGISSTQRIPSRNSDSDLPCYTASDSNNGISSNRSDYNDSLYGTICPSFVPGHTNVLDSDSLLSIWDWSSPAAKVEA